MPPTNKHEGSGGENKVTGLPDRDNPLAWKRATLAGAEGARKLLVLLTDEEVRRYMAVARDQIRSEERLAGLKVASAICGALVVVWFLWQGIATGFGKWVVAGLGVGVAMGYWPWRALQCKQLWQKHFDAARDELTNRNVSV